jgi:hypothetical protein
MLEMVFVMPTYVEIAHRGLDLIERNEPLPIGSVHKVTDLKRLGIITLEERLKQGWLVARNREEYKIWKTQGVPPPPIEVPEPEVAPMKKAKKVKVVTEEPEPEPPKPKPKPQAPLVTGTPKNPVRDGMSMDDYWQVNIIDSTKKRPVAKCPDCGTVKRAKRKLFECCPGDSVFSPPLQ